VAFLALVDRLGFAAADAADTSVSTSQRVMGLQWFIGVVLESVHFPAFVSLPLVIVAEHSTRISRTMRICLFFIWVALVILAHHMHSVVVIQWHPVSNLMHVCHEDHCLATLMAAE
jgi:hypothetical protein